MLYDIPEQDLSVSLSRIPAEPKSRFVIANVRVTGRPKVVAEEEQPQEAPSSP
ncbi:MAG: hypothetical protein GF331_26030 [Chitinivibrionales bacterium]|nr:hypothetical protein [Chitinivibrionales bacterium]